MGKRYNSTAVMEVLVVITSRLYFTGTPFSEEDFDEWQSRLLGLVREMSDQLDKEDVADAINAEIVLKNGMRSYEDLLHEFSELVRTGIPTWRVGLRQMSRSPN